MTACVIVDGLLTRAKSKFEDGAVRVSALPVKIWSAGSGAAFMRRVWTRRMSESQDKTDPM